MKDFTELTLMLAALSLVSMIGDNANASISNSSNVSSSAKSDQLDKETTDYLLSLLPTQSSYIRKTEILGIGGGNWAIVVNGSVINNNPDNNATSVSGRIVDFRAVQQDDTIYETFVKTGEFGGFSVVFTPPSADIVTMTAELADVNPTVQETISVVVSESLLPLILIAILLGVAIFILVIYWHSGKVSNSQLKWGIFFVDVPIILAFIILARFPVYNPGGNSAIGAALLTPIAGYLIELLKQDKKPT